MDTMLLDILDMDLQCGKECAIQCIEFDDYFATSEFVIDRKVNVNSFLNRTLAEAILSAVFVTSL